ncbi:MULTISPECIES: hydroxymethylglutaryl-CoA synthase family protein [unclassified Flavobacterium]|uniref:hydroxymethylglutaryl-CoA synthase family protein n=1 Tax=unclassified Flavobacterium TaxID=196869 RepID=UPI001F13C44F|nr:MULTISPECIES: hydroxymethylglutaryl-CoA synthase [unclassified Flavobacterium]UMY66214.1 hydroxymethylglutaryl-CoA synthase [Flavobacterium sp. HJ-32-4]
MTVGIDAVAFDVARIHLPITSLATARGIDPEKLEKGLGLTRMTFPDVHQDAVVFAANALTRLAQQENLDFRTITRLYVGSESGIDNAKPIGSFLTALMEQQFGDGVLENCDTVDFTFACIGAVDALQNCLDYIRLHPTEKAIVVATDFAKYDLGSTGEYTQGAGAVALLVSAQPRLLSLGTDWAVSTKGVFDFFKPYRTLAKAEILGGKDNTPWFGHLEAHLEIHKDQPVFDGQYSNQCYMDRTRQAYFSLKGKKNAPATLYDSWSRIIMHLPYAFQGRRMLTEIFALDGDLSLDATDAEFPQKLKDLAKSDAYRGFVTEKLQPAERASSLIGNLYTGSIFMGLLSTLADAAEKNTELSGSTFGFMAYGSGSKSKVFEGTVENGWKSQIEKIHLFETLAASQEMDFDTYESLHRKERGESVRKPEGEWRLASIETTRPNLIGARYYEWVAPSLEVV